MATTYALGRVTNFGVGLVDYLIQLSKAVSPDGDSYFSYVHVENYDNISYQNTAPVYDSPWAHWIFMSSSTSDAEEVLKSVFVSNQVYVGTLAGGDVTFAYTGPGTPMRPLPSVTFPSNPTFPNTEGLTFNPTASDYLTLIESYSWTAAAFGTMYSSSVFWADVRDPAVTLADLWSNYGPLMESMGVQALQYRELVAKSETGFVAGALVGRQELNDMADAIISGGTKGELLANFGGAAIAYGDQLRSVIEGSFLTPAQAEAAANQKFTELHTLLRQGTKLSALTGQYGRLLSQNPGGYIMWDQWARTGMYPR